MYLSIERVKVFLRCQHEARAGKSRRCIRLFRTWSEGSSVGGKLVRGDITGIKLVFTNCPYSFVIVRCERI
jgi:hypothetical protein